jgi:hypothetical protein
MRATIDNLIYDGRDPMNPVRLQTLSCGSELNVRRQAYRLNLINTFKLECGV